MNKDIQEALELLNKQPIHVAYASYRVHGKNEEFINRLKNEGITAIEIIPRIEPMTVTRTQVEKLSRIMHEVNSASPWVRYVTLLAELVEFGIEVVDE